MTQDGKAAGDSPLNVRPHAEISVNENTKVTHRRGWNDVMRPNPECRLQSVAVGADGEQWHFLAAKSVAYQSFEAVSS